MKINVKHGFKPIITRGLSRLHGFAVQAGQPELNQVYDFAHLQAIAATSREPENCES